MTENTGKYNNLSVPITREAKRVDRNGKEIKKNFILKITVY